MHKPTIMTNAIEMLALLAEDLTTEELIQEAIKASSVEDVFSALEDINDQNERVKDRLSRLKPTDPSIKKQLAEAEYQVKQYNNAIAKILDDKGIEGSGQWVPIANIKQQAALEEFMVQLAQMY